ncbi:MAG TPA: carboxypeptidase regulatory-like domain-containing protein [Terriglobales bacterium]|nr:carboxypeptidase regulatory-like domain-containing protein [Terriglobales bacterium]
MNRNLQIAIFMLAGVWIASGQGDPAQTGVPQHSRQASVLVTVKDENHDPVAGARVTLMVPGSTFSLVVETDFAGHYRFFGMRPGKYMLEIEKQGFYPNTLGQIELAPGSEIPVTLRHVQEFRERVDVTDTAPAVDPAKTSSSEELTNREIFTLPYPTTRDFRNVLPFIPGVVVDNNQQIHVGGSAGYELFHQLDGFNVTHPVTGLLDLRVSPDSLRLIEVDQSRYTAQYGKGSGGVLRLETGMGDDRFRYSATNFTPGVSVSKGIAFENVTPRFTFSGPIRKGRAWWFEGLSGEYDANANKDLPSRRENSSPLWRIDSISKAQVNLTPGNILTASYVINHQKVERLGLSLLTPPASTTDQHAAIQMFNLRDSAYSGQTLLETGIAGSEFTQGTLPRGGLPFILRPEGVSGSFFEQTSARARRIQGYSNLYLAPTQLYGRHEMRIGIDVDSIDDHQFLSRQPISIVREDGTLARLSTFASPPLFRKDNFEGSAYAQDRWSPTERWIVEYGLRGDWDETIRDAWFSPRVATSYYFDGPTMTKISGGVGIFYDATNLDFVTRSLQGVRTDQDFAADGVTPIGRPMPTFFMVNTNALQEPHFLNASFSFERMLPKAIHLTVEVLEKRGRQGFTFFNVNPTPITGNAYQLLNVQNNRYDSVGITAQKKFAQNHEILISYIRSRSRSNAVLDFSIDNPTLAQQAGGALPWDVPNHLISWGWFPITKRIDFAYSMDWHSGFPFSVINQAQQIVGGPDSRRFPNYFSLNLHVERRFRFRGYEFAFRVGSNNITGSKNAAVVNNNIDSPQFLTLSSFQKRAFTGRIRFLGRK